MKELWMALLDYAMIYAKGDIHFTFKEGNEKSYRMKGNYTIYRRYLLSWRHRSSSAGFSVGILR